MIRPTFFRLLLLRPKKNSEEDVGVRCGCCDGAGDAAWTCIPPDTPCCQRPDRAATLAQHTIFAANLTFPEKLRAASKRAGQVAARLLAKRKVSGVHFLTSEKEITELVWLLRASGIRVLHDTDVAALVDIHLEVHKELRAAMVARAKLTRVENVEEGVEKIMPVKAPVAEICTPCMPVAGTPVAHKPRNMSESVDPRKILMRVDRDGKPSYMPGWAVKHWAARARASSSGVVGTAMP